MPTLDQIVKGAPAPNTSINHVAASAYANPPPHTTVLQHPLPHDVIDLKTPRPPTFSVSDPLAVCVAIFAPSHPH